MKIMLKRWAAVTLLLALLTGLAVPAWAAGSEVQPPEPAMWDSTFVLVRGVDGQEYIIAPKGAAPDWSKAEEPEDGFVSFVDLTPATIYLISTRVKGEAGEPETTELVTPLTGLGLWADDNLKPGVTLNVTPDPEDTQGLTYQWYYDDGTVDEDGLMQHDLTAIDGAVGEAYTIRDEDMGKTIAVKALRDGKEVGEVSLGPVTDGILPPEYDVCPRDDTCPISQFSDASPTAWYHDGVHWALDWGLMNGTGETTFEPNGTATRAMLVTILWRFEGEPDADVSSFTDVKADAWYANAVAWAAEAGAVNGTSETTFSPNASVTREQLVTILYRYAEYLGVAKSPDANILDYDDVFDISSRAVLPFRWAVEEGVITGVGDDRLAPKDNATRAQIAAMIQRFYDVLDRVASEDWTCFGTFDNDEGYAINIDLLTDDGYPVKLTLADGEEYSGFLYKQLASLYGVLSNEAGDYITISVTYDGVGVVSVLFEYAYESDSVKTGDRIDLEP